VSEQVLVGWQPPAEFDGFRVVRLLGAGAMGRVYLARETMLERDVAVKFIAAEKPEPAALERFLIEARAVARLQHPNVVSVYRIGEVEGRPYVVSELVTGKSLDQLELPLPWKRVLAIGLGLARGLAAAQARGILHRDIKPANVMVTDDGDVKLVDFGIAKLVDTLPAASIADSEQSPATMRLLESAPTMTDLAIATPTTPADRERASSNLTRAGTVLGTPRYLAPELWAGSRASLRSDVFSFGVVLYELCAGAGSSGAVKDRGTIEGGLQSLRHVAPEVPAKLADLIDRCVVIDPDARFSSALEVREALELVAAELAGAPQVEIRSQRLFPGELIARRYEVLRTLHEAAGRTAYEVLDRELDEAVALTLFDVTGEAARKLRADIRVARRLSHPNAARVLDLGQHGGHLFVTTEPLRGSTLREVLRAIAAGEREPLPFERIVDLVLQLAAALSAAHRANIAHGSVTMDHVVLEPQRAVLEGFGTLDRTGDPTADQTQWAALAYTLLAGQPAEGPPAPLPATVGDELVRAALDVVFDRALQLAPSDGFASIDELAEAFAFAARGTTRVAVPQVAKPAVTDDTQASRVATVLAFWPGRADQALDTASIEIDVLERTITEVGGTIVSSRPEELIALFGAPRALGDDVVRATRAAHALVARTRNGRAGLHTGRIDLAEARRARGATVERACELAGAAIGGDVLVSEVTARHLLGRFATNEIAPACHRVMPNASVVLHDLPPLHGRDRELAQLEQLVLGSFEQRVAQAACIVGPAGIGKSRLRIELERRLAGRRDSEWLVARAHPLGGGVPLGLLQDCSREWFEVAEAAAPAGRVASFNAARRWLEQRAAVRPVVIALDDLHWADDASREFLSGLRRDLDRLPVAILLFSRPGVPVPEVDLQLELPPIDSSAAREIAARFAPSAAPAVIDEMIQRAGGNPFFLEELAHHATESGTADLPASVELAIQARLDQLPPVERRVATVASVIGRELDRAALEAALAIEPIPDDTLDRALVELERRQIIARLGASAVLERYAFHHVLIREVAYARLDELTRRRIHAALAGHYDTRLARIRRDPALLLALARHRDAAGDRAAARDAYRSAGELALSLAAYREANLALVRAEELSDGNDRTLLELSGDALLQLDSAAATQRFERALALATTPLDRARLLYKLGTAAYHRSENQVAVELFERGLAMIEPVDVQTSDRETKLTAARLLAIMGSVISYDVGDHRRGLPHAERAVVLFEKVGDLLELAGGLSRLGGAYLRAGRWNDRLRCNLRHLQIAETLGDLDRQLAANVNLGINYHSVGRLDAALEHTRKGLELSVRCGRATTRALAHNNLGVILADADQPELARKELLEACTHAERSGYMRFLYETYSTLALLDLRAGDLVNAEAQIKRSAQLARDSQSPLYEGIADRILAGIAAAAGRNAEATELLVLAHARIGDDYYERARTTALESKLARRAGNTTVGDELREKARVVFEQLGAALDLAKLDDLTDVR
jgi:serine/threonine protein kinase/tetratricopeptide (TPR) repeat protein